MRGYDAPAFRKSHPAMAHPAAHAQIQALHFAVGGSKIAAEGGNNQTGYFKLDPVAPLAVPGMR